MFRSLAPALLMVAPTFAPVFAQTPARTTAVTPGAVAVDAGGNVFISDIGTWQVRRIDAATGTIANVGAGGLVTQGSGSGIAIDRAGNLFIADGQGARILRIDATTHTTTVIAGGGPYPFLGDGGPATEIILDHPFGIAVDSAGDVYFAEWGAHRIRKVIASSGIITTVAGNGSPAYSGDGGPAVNAGVPNPSDVAVDAKGNIYIAEWANNDVNRVRVVDGRTGIITTLAGNGSCGEAEDGGYATQQSLCGPYAIALGGSNELFVADIYHRAYRIALDTKKILHLAGTGYGYLGAGFSGDGGPSTAAELNTPEGIAVDAHGNVYIADTHNNRVRRIDAATGIITTIAGNGFPSDSEHTRRRAVAH